MAAASGSKKKMKSSLAPDILQEVAGKGIPWLLLPYNPATTTRSFYNLSTNTTHSYDCDADLVNRVVCGSSFGWLALIATDSTLSLSLWNPLTKATIALPPTPATGFPSKIRWEDQLDEHGNLIYPGYMRPGGPLKVSLSSDPTGPTSSDCFVIVVLSMSRSFAYCKIGDEAWTIRDSNVEQGHTVHSVVFRHGKFYVLNRVGSGVVIDVDDPSTRSEIPFPPDINFFCRDIGTFLAKAKDDELYLMQWTESSRPENKNNEEDEERVSIKLFKLIVNEGYQWEPLQSLADHSLFLSANHFSVVRTSIWTLLAATDRVRSNSIYFSEYRGLYPTTSRMDLHYISVYKIDEGRLESLSCPKATLSDSCSPTWFMPSWRFFVEEEVYEEAQEEALKDEARSK